MLLIGVIGVSAPHGRLGLADHVAGMAHLTQRPAHPQPGTEYAVDLKVYATTIGTWGVQHTQLVGSLLGVPLASLGHQRA